MNKSIKTILISLAGSLGTALIIGAGKFYYTTKTQIEVLNTKLEQINSSISEIKTEKKELTAKVAQMSEDVYLLKFRVGNVKPANASVTRNINPKGSKTSMPLSEVLGGK